MAQKTALRAAIEKEEERLRKLKELERLQEELDRKQAALDQEVTSIMGNVEAEPPARYGGRAMPVMAPEESSGAVLQGKQQAVLLAAMHAIGDHASITNILDELLGSGNDDGLEGLDRYQQIRLLGKRMQIVKRKGFVEAVLPPSGRTSDYTWRLTPPGTLALLSWEERKRGLFNAVHAA